MTGKLALDYLEDNDLSQKESIRLLNILTKQLNTFPLKDVLEVSPDGGTLANGQKLTLEELVKFRSGIDAIKDNWAFQLLADQVLFLAIKHGIHYGDTTDKLMFSKSAIYFITKFRELLVTFDIRQ